MMHPRLHKQNCAVLRRSSQSSQADNSNSHQARTVDQVLKMYEMTAVHEIDLKGVSGSLPGNRSDIAEIIAAKQRLRNFGFLILPSADRFTRAGSMHGVKMLWDLAVAGITVYFVKEDLFSDDERGRLYLGFLFDAARQTAIAIGTATAEGLTYAIIDGKHPYCTKPPFGLDRLYWIGDRRLHIIRNLRDGTQEMWTPEKNPEDRKLMRTFARNPKKGTPNHYRKQKNESVSLIPGDRKVVKVISYMMELRWVQGLGGRLVTRRLNDLAVADRDFLSPAGRRWSTGTVSKMIHNAVYTGVGIRFMGAWGVYILSSKRGKPTASSVTIEELANMKSPTRRPRPREDWIEQPQPHLEGLLSEHIHEATVRGIEIRLNKRARGQHLSPDTNKYKNSGRLFSRILHSKQGNCPMVGAGGSCPEREYYQTAQNVNQPQSNTVMNKMIPGRSMRVAVLECLKDAILSKPDLSAAMAKAVKLVLKEESADDSNKIERELMAACAQQVRLTRNLKGDAKLDKETITELDLLDERIHRFRETLRLTRKSAPRVDPAVDVSRLTKEFIELGGAIDDMDIAQQKAMVKCLIQRMVVDLETREIEMDLALPGDMYKLFAASGKDSLVAHLCSQSRHEKASVFGPKLGSYLLEYRWKEHLYVWKRLKSAS